LVINIQYFASKANYFYEGNAQGKINPALFRKVRDKQKRAGQFGPFFV
jgi:hypothetical protein